LLGLLLQLAACATTRPVRPLAPKETSLGVSLGGPLINTLGAVFPTPMLTVAGARGVSEQLALTGALNLTAALFGTVHIEPGVVFFPVLSPHGGVPTVAVHGSWHLLTDFSGGDDGEGAGWLLGPHLATVASWRLGAPLLGYAGVEGTFAFSPGSSRAGRLLAGPLLGVELARGRARFGLECKWLAPHHDVEPAAPEWISPGRHGYLSVVLGFGYHFGGRP
jgi:hypothetical protein